MIWILKVKKFQFVDKGLMLVSTSADMNAVLKAGADELRLELFEITAVCEGTEW